MIFHKPDEKWHKWFAWRPVSIERGIAWLCHVERRWVKDLDLRIIDPYDPGEYAGGYEYREIPESDVCTTNIYFLEKTGCYSHGVFWIGTDISEGIEKTNIAAENDKDRYHSWDLVMYAPVDEYTIDAMHDVVYSKRKGD